MSNLTDKEDKEIAELNIKLTEIGEALARRCIYTGDRMFGRNTDGSWTEVIFSGVNPDEEKPFYTELPDGSFHYFDRLAESHDTDDLGTQNEIEGELTEADIHSWY